MSIAPLPEKFAWLAKYVADGHPRMVAEALKLYGMKEVPGEGDNPEIVALAKEIGLEGFYKHDAMAWCGLFMAAIAKRAGKALPEGEPVLLLRALHWRAFGTEVANDEAMFGDALIFTRKGGGHVGIYVGETKYSFFVLGGNEADQVNIIRMGAERLVAVRRPRYRLTPTQVRKVVLAADGTLSTNEA